MTEDEDGKVGYAVPVFLARACDLHRCIGKIKIEVNADYSSVFA